jgi:glycosyltransferase involved in cell wall biosynthesis
MRIAFYAPRATYLTYPEIISGDTVMVHLLLTTLRERGHDVEIASRQDVRALWCPAPERISLRHFAAEARATARRMKRFSPDAWLVYAPAITYPDLLGWWQRARRYVIYGGMHSGHGSALPRRWRPLFKFGYRRCLRRADQLAVFRQKSADRVRREGVRPERVSVLPPCGRTWRELPSQEEARQRLGLPSESPVVLCVSRFSERKTGSVVDLVRAFATLPPDALLVLVGDGPGRGEIESEAAAAAVRDRVHLLGTLTDLSDCYVASDLLAFPDRHQDSPRLAIVEAQGCGCPVVVRRSPSAQLTVNDGKSGLLARDLDEFTAALGALARDRARCAAMGRAAREYVDRHHSIDVRVRQIETMLAGG